MNTDGVVTIARLTEEKALLELFLESSHEKTPLCPIVIFRIERAIYRINKCIEALRSWE